jgi:hypothetical protein
MLRYQTGSLWHRATRGKRAAHHAQWLLSGDASLKAERRENINEKSAKSIVGGACGHCGIGHQHERRTKSSNVALASASRHPLLYQNRKGD